MKGKPLRILLVVSIATLILGIILFLCGIKVSRSQLYNLITGFTEGNESNCDKILVNPMRDWCLYVSALKDSSEPTCGKITQDTLRRRCSAVVRGDPSVCNEILDKEGRFDCYGELAEHPRNPATCEFLKNKADGDKCYYNLIIENPEDTVRYLPYCDGMGNESFKDRCFNYIAVHSKNISLCDRIVDQERKGICSSYIQRRTKH